LETISCEDWFVSRNKIAKFEEFVDNLIQKQSDSPNPQPIDDWMKNQLEAYKVQYIFLLFNEIIH